MVLSLGLSEGAAPTHWIPYCLHWTTAVAVSAWNKVNSHVDFTPFDIQSWKAIPIIHVGFSTAVIPLIPYNLIFLLSFMFLVVGSGLIT